MLIRDRLILAGASVPSLRTTLHFERWSPDLWIARRIVLLLLLAGELVYITLPIHFPEQLLRHGWIALAFATLKGSRQVLITATFVVIVLGWREVGTELRRIRAERAERGASVWLVAHFGLVTVLVLGTAFKGSDSISAGRIELWVLSWTLLGLGALLTWSFALLPPRFWVGWYRRSPRVFLYGLSTGAITYLLSTYTQAVWPLLQGVTFSSVAALLRLVVGSAIVLDPAQSVIGMTKFSVRIVPGCSGLEGIALVGCFLGLYLWFYRNKLQFPRAFVLVPIGLASAFFLNSVRIASLILLGNWLPAASLQGFHSVAGWLLFNLLVCALVWGSWRFGLFVDDHAKPADAVSNQPSAARLLEPLLAMIAVSMISQTLPGGVATYYPLQVLAAVCLLWINRAEFASLDWKPSAAAILPGGLAFVLWTALARNNAAPEVRSVFIQRSLMGAVVWTTPWIVGSIVVVPIVEELAFRDYLRRKLIALNFETVALNRFTWLSFLGSSLVFGAFHGEFLAGTAVGMVFVLAVCRRGVISDAVLAHATSNALFCAYALVAGRSLLPS